MMYNTTLTEISIHRNDDSPIFGSSATKVRLDDEAGGMFIVLSQDTDERNHQELFLDFEEMEEVYKAFKLLTQQSGIS